MKCGHCGAPAYSVVNGPCRYCGTGTASAPAAPVRLGGARHAQVGRLDEPIVDQPPSARPYPLSYTGVATYIWQWTAGYQRWQWVTAAALAVLAIGAAWFAVWCWCILAELLDVLHRTQRLRVAGWLLRTGVERPWFGFALGSVVAATMLVLTGIALHVR